MNHNYIVWEEHAIEAEAGKLPEKMRELYVWLKIFTRDQCGRELSSLVEKFKRVGVTTDITNWSRILKGRWNINAKGEEDTPCVSQQTFITNVTALKENIRVENLEGGVPFVETSVFTMIKNFIEKKMRKDRVNKWGLIVGPTGTQKTASFKELTQRNRMVKWGEASDTGSIVEFTMRFCAKFGGGSNINYRAARNKLFSNVTKDHCLIVDNMQDMVRDLNQLKSLGRDIYSQPAFGLMRSLQDETGCAIIWSITPENEDQLFSAKDESQIIYNEQFEGRFGGVDSFLRLPNFSPKKDVIQIAEELGIQFDGDKHGDRLHEISKERGRIRRFFEILQEAKDEAALEKTRASMKHVELVMTRITEDAARRVTKVKGAK